MTAYFGPEFFGTRFYLILSKAAWQSIGHFLWDEKTVPEMLVVTTTT